MNESIEIENFSDNDNHNFIVKEKTEDGVPTEIELLKNTIYRGILFKGGTKLYLYYNGQTSKGTLAETTKLRVWLQDYSFERNTELRFDEGGTVRQGTLAEPVSVGAPYDIEVKKGKIYFYSGGGIFHCWTADEVWYEYENGPSFSTKNGTELNFYPPSGTDDNPHVSVSWCVLASVIGSRQFDDIRVLKDNRVSFFESKERSVGLLQSCMIENDHLLQGHRCRDKSYLSLYENRNIKNYTIAQDAHVLGVELKANTSIVELTEVGQLKKIQSSHHVVIRGKAYPKWATIMFDTLGNVVSPVL